MQGAPVWTLVKELDLTSCNQRSHMPQLRPGTAPINKHSKKINKWTLFPPHMMTCTFISAKVDDTSQAEHRGQFPLLPTNIRSTLTSAHLTSQVCLLPLSTGRTTKSLPLDYKGGLSVLILASAHHCSTCKHSGFSKYKSDHTFWVSPARPIRGPQLL